ncbi:MAG: hypothetical protein NWE93_11175 [Candidatus Bathyarchaeota archaeon]|nr:hypothetical protein [Candidatus Bathyarchaeota archaeon]
MKNNNSKSACTLLVLLCLAVTLIYSSYPPSQAQAVTAFSSTDQFSAPSQNSTIRFAFNGTYASANLQNGTWTFNDLKLNTPNAAFLGLDTLNTTKTLKFSAENSNVTILAFQAFNYSSAVTVLSYTATGEGTQTVNLGLNLTEPTDSSQWSIIVEDDVFLAEGQGWRLLSDDSILVSAPVGNITIAHFDFGGSVGNVGFLLEHYVLLFTGVVLAVTLAAAVLIRTRRQHRRDIRNSNKPSAAS